MKEILNKLENELILINNPILYSLESPESLENSIDVISRLKLTINQEMIELFKWKRGVDAQSYFNQKCNCELFSGGVFFPLSTCVSFYLLDKSTNKFYKNQFFPLFYSSTGDIILIDLKGKSSTYGKLFISAPSITLSSKPVGIYDSLYTCIKTIIDCYTNKAYTINKEGILEIDFDIEHKISRENNPNSDFWNEIDS